MTAAAKAIDDAERRELRDSYRRATGDKRRPLRSFQTKADKRARRDAHAGTLRAAMAQLADPVGFERWLEALALNPHLSASNCALVALQTPGEVVYTSAGWHREGYTLRAGLREAGRITAPGFWPLAYFTAAQVGVKHLAEAEAALPSRERSEGLRAALAAALEDPSVKPREALDRLARIVANETRREVREVVSRGPQVEPEALF